MHVAVVSLWGEPPLAVAEEHVDAKEDQDADSKERSEDADNDCEDAEDGEGPPWHGAKNTPSWRSPKSGSVTVGGAGRASFDPHHVAPHDYGSKTEGNDGQDDLIGQSEEDSHVRVDAPAGEFRGERVVIE